jgi:hypothetical protein
VRYVLEHVASIDRHVVGRETRKPIADWNFNLDERTRGTSPRGWMSARLVLEARTRGLALTGSCDGCRQTGCTRSHARHAGNPALSRSCGCPRDRVASRRLRIPSQAGGSGPLPEARHGGSQW